MQQVHWSSDTTSAMTPDTGATVQIIYLDTRGMSERCRAKAVGKVIIINESYYKDNN